MRAIRSPLFWLTWPLGSILGFMVPFFAFWLLADALGSFVRIDLDAAMDTSPLVFAALLGSAFAAGGAGLGFVQWLHVRQDVPRSLGWIAGMAAGFGAVAILYIAIWEAFGGADAFWARMTNEIVHNAFGGGVAGFILWRYVVAPRVSASAWVAVLAVAMVAGGLAAWAAEAAMGIAAGDAAPVGILVSATITGWAYRRLPRGAAAAGAEPLGGGQPS